MKTERARASALGRLLVACLLVLAAARCGGCEQPAAYPGPVQAVISEFRATPPAGGDELDLSKSVEVPLPGVEAEPDMGWIRQHAGELDVANRYRSTVMLALDESLGQSHCSAVLLDSRLAVTAASCVCALEVGKLAGVGAESRADTSSCVKRVFVTAVLYGAAGHPNALDVTTAKRFLTTQGTVTPHTDLELILDGKGRVVGGHADLAVILLDDALEVAEPGFLLPRGEVQEGESLTMTGYGHDKAVGGVYGARYFRRNRAVGTAASGSDRFFYQQQGPASYQGFAGGPCFREENGRRWLVGVASFRPGQDLQCTSTTFYRSWLVNEMKRARSRPPNP